MGEHPNALPPDSELVRELNLTKPEWLLTAAYWERRISGARNQRNALVYLVLFFITHLCTRSLGEIERGTSAFVSLVDILNSWIFPIALVATTAMLVLMEVMVYVLNKSVAKHLPAAKLARIISLGNEVAMHTLLFRKVPKGNDA